MAETSIERLQRREREALRALRECAAILSGESMTKQALVSALEAARAYLSDQEGIASLWNYDLGAAPRDGSPVMLYGRHPHATAYIRIVGHWSPILKSWLAVSFVATPQRIVVHAWAPLDPSFPHVAPKDERGDL